MQLVLHHITLNPGIVQTSSQLPRSRDPVDMKVIFVFISALSTVTSDSTSDSTEDSDFSDAKTGYSFSNSSAIR